MLSFAGDYRGMDRNSGTSEFNGGRETRFPLPSEGRGIEGEG